MLPISYQYGTPISIVPEPLGDIVDLGLNFTTRVFDEVETPKTLELVVILTFPLGVIACWIVILGMAIVRMLFWHKASENPRIFKVLRICDEKGV